MRLNENYIDQKTTRLLESWAPRMKKLESVTGRKNSLERNLVLAHSLENTKIQAKFHESIQTADAGLYKIFALDIVGAVVQNLIAPEIVSVQGMDNSVGMVLYLEYKYGTTKGATKAGTAFADTRNFYQSDAMYSSCDVVDEPITLVAGTSQSFTLVQPAPINPNTITITLSIGGNSVVLTDNGAGTLVSPVSGYSGTINYSTGAVTLTLGAAATAATDTGVVNYSYAITYVDSTASSVRIPEVTLQMNKIPMFAKPRRMKAIWSFDSQYILNKEYGGTDMEDIMNATVAGEIMHEIDSEVMTDLYRAANAGPEQTWSDVVPMGISMIDQYNTFKIAVDKCCAKIYKATRKVRGNFLVGGVSVGTVCSSIVGFEAADVQNVNGPCYFGKLPNGVKVYLNPDFDDDVFVVGYKGSNMFDTGYILGMYMPVVTVPMVQLEDLAGRKGWAASYGKAVVNNRMYIRGRIVHN